MAPKSRAPFVHPKAEPNPGEAPMEEPFVEGEAPQADEEAAEEEFVEEPVAEPAAEEAFVGDYWEQTQLLSVAASERHERRLAAPSGSGGPDVDDEPLEMNDLLDMLGSQADPPEPLPGPASVDDDDEPDMPDGAFVYKCVADDPIHTQRDIAATGVEHALAVTPPRRVH